MKSRYTNSLDNASSAEDAGQDGVGEPSGGISKGNKQAKMQYSKVNKGLN